MSLLRPLYNEAQDEITGWENLGQVWANVSPTMGVEGSGSGRVVSQMYLIITIRYRADVDARWRITDRAATYEIESKQIPHDRLAALRLNCKEVL